MNTNFQNIIMQGRFLIDIYLCKHCNLKCRACSRYCNINDEEFYPFNDLIKDLRKIKNSDTRCHCISFSGGEPLLHPELFNILKYTRMLFPNINLVIFTNGLLFKKLGVPFYKLLKALNIQIIFTQYPCKIDYTFIVNTCKEYGITYFNALSKDIDFADNCECKTFWTNRLSENSFFNTSVKRFYMCNNDCCCLWKGKLYKCCSMPFVDTLNKKYGTNFEVKEDDYLELKDGMSYDDFIEYFLSACPFCKYCFNVMNEEIPWENCNPQRSDWVG